jgi:hypothetical protein
MSDVMGCGQMVRPLWLTLQPLKITIGYRATGIKVNARIRVLASSNYPTNNV